MMNLFARVAHLPELSARYPATGLFDAPVLHRQVVKIGRVRYRRCVDVSMPEAGLYLDVRPRLGSRYRLLIPWREFHSPRLTRLYWSKAVIMRVGRPMIADITVYERLYQGMTSRLPASPQ